MDKFQLDDDARVNSVNLSFAGFCRQIYPDVVVQLSILPRLVALIDSRINRLVTLNNLGSFFTTFWVCSTNPPRMCNI